MKYFFVYIVWGIMVTYSSLYANPRLPVPKGKMWPTQALPKKDAKTKERINEKQGRKVAALYRSTIGLVTTAFCVQTYFSLKGAADGLTKRLYSQKAIAQQAKSALETILLVDNKLAGIERTPLRKADKDSLWELRYVLKRLKRQARSLLVYALKLNKKNYRQHEADRLTTWRDLKRILK